VRWLIAQDGARVIPAGVHHRQAERGDHKDDRSPGGEPSKNVGCGTGSEGSLRALATESACEIGRTALLHKDDADQKDAHQDMERHDEVEKNLHC